MRPEDWWHERATIYVSSQIMYHLNRVGVFNWFYENGGGTCQQISKQTATSPRVLEVLLEYLSAVDSIIEKDPSRPYFFLSEFGRKVLARYSREHENKTYFNFFDVRIGGYESVWTNLDKLLKGEIYGERVRRKGEDAAEGLFRSSEGFIKAIIPEIRQGRYSNIVELGICSGISLALAREFPELKFYGIDRRREENKTTRPDNFNFIQADIFKTQDWSGRIDKNGSTLFFSVHFHEFAAKGLSEISELIRDMGKSFKGDSVIALEQPLLDASERSKIPASLWQYAHSNVLIHHLIGNGKILSDNDWRKLLAGNNAGIVEVKTTGFLGYNLYKVTLI